jgi:NADP-dependent 3-hydroxy acid dehydrogenase YdfG
MIIFTLNNLLIIMNKTILITGASSGIGEGCARKFASQGARIILNSRSTEKLESLAQDLKEKYNADCYVMPFDVCDRDSAAAALKALPEEWQSIDVLINNAGLAIGVDKEHEGNPDEWDVMIDTNIKALLSMTRLVVPGMVERGRGHIINIGSIAGDAAYPGGSVYCATKAAVKALSDGLRIDLVDTPLRVTNIKPGLVETNFSVVRFRGDKERADNVYRGIKPLTGDDIAEVAYFAASAPEHMQVAEILVMPTYQATGTIVSKNL